MTVRLYLLDSEVEALLAAGGSCGGCSTISDAFIAGVTKYAGINENGDLMDNTSGTYTLTVTSANGCTATATVAVEVGICEYDLALVKTKMLSRKSKLFLTKMKLLSWPYIFFKI